MKKYSMKVLNVAQMEFVSAGDKTCSTVTGFFCGATVILAFSTVFAPLAGATAVGCLAGVATGCTNR